jgi:hypothetical protein
MAEFQWWLLIVGLLAGGGLVAVVTMDSRRREEDIGDLERRAEATWIAGRVAGRRERSIDPRTVEAVLRAHREYLSLPPPDELVVVDAEVDESADELDRDPDQMADQVRDDGRRGADEDLART